MSNVKWTKEGCQYLLKIGDTVFITLDIIAPAAAKFKLNERAFTIEKKGAWNPAYYLTENGAEVLKLTHNFWGSNGKITCWDNTVYKCEYSNKNGLHVRFLDGENELLSYYHSKEASMQAVGFHIGTSMEDAEKLLQLVALGMVLFTSLIGENYVDSNDDSNFLLLVAAS